MVSKNIGLKRSQVRLLVALLHHLPYLAQSGKCNPVWSCIAGLGRLDFMHVHFNLLFNFVKNCL